MSYLDDCGGSFDPLSEKLEDSFWETLNDMRERCPVLRSDVGEGFVALSRYEDVAQAAIDTKRFSSAVKGTLPVRPAADFNFVPAELDPPLHLHYRRFLNPYFTKEAAAKSEDQIRKIVIEIMDGFTEDGSCEFKSQFASVLPGRVVYEGVYDAPAEDYDKVLGWIHQFATDPANSGEAIDALVEWGGPVLAARADSDDPEDFVAYVANAEIDGRRLTTKEQVELLITMIIGGLDTGESSVSAAIGYLAGHPELVERMRQGREVIERAVDELLRIDPPAILFMRTAMEDVEYHGETIKAGERVMLYWAAANRDPAKYSAPDEFDIDTKKPAHLSFGWGPHLCIGRHIARLQLVVTIEEVMRRMPDLRLAPHEKLRYRSGVVRFPETVHVEFTPTPAERAATR